MPIKRQVILEGWNEFRIKAITGKAGPEQLKQLRLAYYAGATILSHSIMNILEPDAEPTTKDLEMMDNIHKELEAYIHEQSKAPGVKAEINFSQPDWDFTKRRG